MGAPKSLQVLSQELAVLGLDLQTTLREEPRFLLDARFLGTLHLELAEQLGPVDARAALLQLGFLHGLRDASQVVRQGFTAGSSLLAAGCGPKAPRLAIQLQPSAVGRLRVFGAWPERHEAEAVLTSCGPQAEATCQVSAGYTSGWLSGIFDADILVLETSCGAGGGVGCAFEAREPRAWLSDAAPSALDCLAALPFAELREVVARHLDTEMPSPEENEGFEAGAPVVHVWGPLMVIPFAGPEESMRALDLIGRDPGAREVCVVVVDLSGAIIDDAFGAASLEQILDAIESWGAEPILTGLSPLSEAAVADLEKAHLVIHKDLPEAIAAGFQIADVQRQST